MTRASLSVFFVPFSSGKKSIKIFFYVSKQCNANDMKSFNLDQYYYAYNFNYKKSLPTTIKLLFDSFEK